MGEIYSGAAGKELLPQRPTYGAQVMVQSEEERLLRKQVRKEEKKIAKILGKVDPGMEDEEGGEEIRDAIQCCREIRVTGRPISSRTWVGLT